MSGAGESKTSIPARDTGISAHDSARRAPAHGAESSPRHATPQPNVPGKGIVASYSPKFWATVIGVGVASGIGGAALIGLLKLIEKTAFNYHSGSYLSGIERTSAAHRVLVLLAAGVIAGVGGHALQRVRGSGAGEISDALWNEDARLPFWRSIGRGALSIVIVAMGASLGREAAPQLAGAASASGLSEFAKLPAHHRRLLVACGGGAGMAAVYNVPLGGALFALEVLLGTVTLSLVLPALITSLIATAIAWITLGDQPIYYMPQFKLAGGQILWAAIIGPLAGLAAITWVRTIAFVNNHKPDGLQRIIAPMVVFTALGALAIAYPTLLGNGQDIVQLAIGNGFAVSTLAVLVLLKPLATSACLGSGAPGGLFTPTLAFGVLFGSLLGHAWSALGGAGAPGSFAIIGGAAVLGASMQAPLAAVVLILELTRNADTLMVPILLGVALATVLARIIGAPSIYSARLGERDAPAFDDDRGTAEYRPGARPESRAD